MATPSSAKPIMGRNIRKAKPTRGMTRKSSGNGTL